MKAFRVSILDKKIARTGGCMISFAHSARRLVCFRGVMAVPFFSGEKLQALCLATLALADEAQELDGYTGGETSKRFIPL